MTIANIFHTGGLTLALFIVFMILEVVFVTQAVKSHHTDKAPYSKIPWTYFAGIVFVLYIIAMLFVASDYKGV